MNDMRQPQTTTYAGQAIDAGLQRFMQYTYHTMGIGLAVTGLAAFVVANTPALMEVIFGTALKWVAIFAPLAFLWMGFTPARIQRLSSAQLRTMFLVFAGVMGISMAALFVVFTGESIARTFFVTAAAFAATSIYGYTTKRDLTKMGSFLFMGMIGIFIAAIVNIFLQSSMMQFIIASLGVVIFTGLTAFETQNLKETYRDNGGDATIKVAVMGALSLYLNFINLFQMLLHFLGQRRE
jgi:hypothetical protein